ncbi:hypothetical protein AB9K35_17665 [Leisingera sp. XS_AS12]|uniref:hypothetical protein n=1 Tax=Leisingera sp. XS_AS12 TaxID=3241294 RepID=UPI00351889FF
MSTLLKALNKSMRKNTPRTLRGSANMVGKVLEYGEKTIKVEVLSGPIAGQEIDIDPGNKKVKDFEKESKAQTSSYTPVGGILRFDSVSAQNDGTYKSKWTNAWIKNPGDEHELLADQQVSYYDTGRTNSNDQPIISLRVLKRDNEQKVTSLDEMRDALADAFASSRSAMVVDTSEGFATMSYYLPGKREGDTYVHKDPIEFATSLIEDLDPEAKEIFSNILSTQGLTIVPVRNITVGPKSAEETKASIEKAEAAGEKARIMTVNPYAYEAPSLGIRLSGALARKDRDGNLEIAAEYAERLKDAFLSTAKEDAKASFHADGWRGVSDTDLKDFFEANGVSLVKHPSMTWNNASIHLQKFDGGSDFFAAKTHEANRYGSPYPALKCCDELRAAYATELHDAVLAVVKAPAATAEAKEEAPAAKSTEAEKPAANEAEQTAEQSEAQAEEAASIDDMLNEIGNEPMS